MLRARLDFHSVSVCLFRLRQERLAGHFLGYGKAHDLEKCGRHITESPNRFVLFKAMRSGGHYKRDWISRMRRMGLIILAKHLFGVSVVGSYEKGVSGLFTCLVNDSNSLVCSFDPLDGGVVHSGLCFSIGMRGGIRYGKYEKKTLHDQPYRVERNCT